MQYEGKETASDPILRYLRRYYLQLDQLDSSPEPDLSWDEADLPQLRPQVWTFNDFMEQYNEIYAWLNNIQVGHVWQKHGRLSLPETATLEYV